MSTYGSGYNQPDINLAGGGAGNVQTTFVFQPGGVAKDNVYTDWAALIAAHAGIAGPKIIEFDDTFVSPVVVPAGTYDLSQTILSGGIGTPIPPPLVNLADGVVFENFEEMETITMTSFSTAPIITARPPILPINTLTIRRGSITTAGTAPFISVLAGAFFSLLLDESAGMFAGTIPPVDLAAPGVGMSLVLDEVGQIDAGVVSGPVGSSVTLIIRDSSAIVPTPPGPPAFLGSLFTILSPQAANVDFTAAPADWVGADPTNVQDAITRIAAALGPIA